MEGLIVRDWLDRRGEVEKEAGGYSNAGKVTYKETVAKGIDQAVVRFSVSSKGRTGARW